MPLTAEQHDRLTREELLELLKQLLPLVAEVERLRQRIEELEAENERLKNQSANSRNSSQPPSRDQKVNQPPNQRRGRLPHDCSYARRFRDRNRYGRFARRSLGL
jgi:regulator of replication initiation timing